MPHGPGPVPTPPRERRETRLLGLLALSLAALAAWQAAGPGEAEDAPAIAMPVRPPGAAAAAPGGAAGGEADIAAILERPLFSQGRGRVAPIAAAQAAPAPPAPPAAPPLSERFQLLGITRGAGGRLTVLLREKGAGQGAEVIRLRAGDALEDWTLLAEPPAGGPRRAVVLARDGEGEGARQVLALPSAAPPGASGGGGAEDEED